jgi:hypothetical protein
MRIIMTIIFILAPFFTDVEGAWSIKFLPRTSPHAEVTRPE